MADLKNMVHDIYAAMSKRDMDGFLSHIADDVIEHETPPVPDPLPGKDGVRQWFELIFSAFPDMDMTAEDTIIEGNKVAVRARFVGSHQGEFMGIPATGKTVDLDVIDILRVDGGKVVEHWGLVDNAALMEQLGVMPS